MAGPSAHSKLSPSASHRWLNCPGSIKLEEFAPEDESSEYADWGTAAHELAEKCLLEGKEPEDFIGEEIYLDYEVDEDMAELTKVYVDIVRDYAQDDHELFEVEKRVDFSHIVGMDGQGGTADGLIIRDNDLIICDLKSGYLRVKAEDNKQLMTYGLAAYDEYSLLYQIDRVLLVIVQPRDSNDPKEYVCELEELEEHRQLLKDAAREIKEAGKFKAESMDDLFENEEFLAYLSPSTSACRWCPAKAFCPSLKAQVEEQILDEFDDVNDAIDQVEDGKRPADKIAEDLGRIDLIEMWCKAVKSKAQELLENGEQLPGYKLVRGRQGPRKWTDKKAAEEMLEKMRYRIDQRYKMKVISPTQAEKLLEDNPRRWEKFQELITRSEGRLQVAPEHDKRDAVVVDVTDEFDDLTQ